MINTTIQQLNQYTKHFTIDCHVAEVNGFLTLLLQFRCGTEYELYMLAVNSLGPGKASPIIRSKTSGTLPSGPADTDLLALNNTWVGLNLKTWSNGHCPISSFVIEYRLMKPILTHVKFQIMHILVLILVMLGIWSLTMLSFILILAKCLLFMTFNQVPITM